MSSTIEDDIRKISKLPENRRCANCEKESDVFGWKNICMPYKTFVCSTCKSAHQSFSHRVKEINQSNFDAADLRGLKPANGGSNDAARRSYLARLPPDSPLRPREGDNLNKYKDFVKMAYEERRWYSEPSAVSTPVAPSPITPAAQASAAPSVAPPSLATPSVAAPRWGPPAPSPRPISVAAPVSAAPAPVTKPAPVEPEVDLLNLHSAPPSRSQDIDLFSFGAAGGASAVPTIPAASATSFSFLAPPTAPVPSAVAPPPPPPASSFDFFGAPAAPAPPASFGGAVAQAAAPWGAPAAAAPAAPSWDTISHAPSHINIAPTSWGVPATAPGFSSAPIIAPPAPSPRTVMAASSSGSSISDAFSVADTVPPGYYAQPVPHVAAAQAAHARNAYLAAQARAQAQAQMAAATQAAAMQQQLATLAAARSGATQAGFVAAPTRDPRSAAAFDPFFGL